MKNIIIIVFLLLFGLQLQAQTTTHYIKINFLYGSKPVRKFKSTEKPLFGGIHGGHVSIEVDSVDVSFTKKGKFHIFPNKKFHSHYIKKELKDSVLYRQGHKWVYIVIPVTEKQYNKIVEIQNRYLEKSPYDYAFFGMRCAAAAQDVLGQSGVLPYKNKFHNILTTFYPRPLRKRMLKMAKLNGYRIYSQPGKESRKWEND